MLARIFGVYLTLLGISFIVIGLLGNPVEPIQKSYVSEFPERVFRSLSRYISVSSGNVEIKVLSEGTSYIVVYRNLMGYRFEKLFDGVVKGYKKLEYKSDLPTSYYIYVRLSGVEVNGSTNASRPKFLLNLSIYPNLNYTFVVGSILLILGVSITYTGIYIDKWKTRKYVLAKQERIRNRFY